MTERIELGTTVTVLPCRNPLLTARVAANIDRFSDGRLILGGGAGRAEREFEALGVPFGERGAITDEYPTATHRLWERREASFSGEYISFRDVAAAPRPVREPHPPIWVGGSSRAAIRRAVRHGTAWHPVFPTLDWLPVLRATPEQDQRTLEALAEHVLDLAAEAPRQQPR
ncbi:alkanesulfonate monooxygenase SsuD/methylene tetrahydromethanopterin reductase-like flavin-dependent oxidoreductase (luciferase family) [Saccharopolyspora lacisalsi]|uniref:Alkanesulfonate monooxygenase SsuD/methylene tetrahydromethanopterin reductase-like flavin-dependent oxidoreductase (Luciferase family) n=1 Tax=Halosaccharopolyspora lacisalsi TaxID=1000566 RepID=A0A839DMY8_9PSEU|nr:alkanesulfonate monooxygenase SsuD/methylene tetrahydromethanopterin reductase-like flavin-dependent oxidoreductase (luciferase family) [Halosaccharopolyspora lacisalsi]